MPHIHTGPGEHDLTASAFIVDVSESQPRLWLHKHKLLGKWLQFGGHVELTENPWQTVRHEIEEESGFAISQLRVLQPALRLKLSDATRTVPQPVTINSHRFTAEMDHYHTDIAFAFITGEEPAHAVAPGESTNLKSFSLADIEQSDPAEILPNVRRISMFVLTSILTDWQPVDCDEFNR